MSNDKTKIVKIASVYTGTVLGAGFASGQELLKFFVRFGNFGIAGLIVACILFFIIGFAALSAIARHKIKSYDELICIIMGEKLGKAMSLIVILFLGILFCTMLAAGGSCIYEIFGYKKIVGITVVSLICFITFLFDVDGIVEINTALCPLLIAGGAVIGIYLFISESVETFRGVLPVVKFVKENWIVSSFVYVSYNVITAIPVLTSLNSLVQNRKTAFYSAVLSGASMCLAGILMSLPLLLKYTEIKETELPLLYLTKLHSNDIITYLYLFVLLAAIFTTAVANGFAIIQWLCRKFEIKPLYIKIAVTAAGMLVAQIGFSNFVGFLYPLFGYIGLFEIFAILWLFFKADFFKN